MPALHRDDASEEHRALHDLLKQIGTVAEFIDCFHALGKPIPTA